MPDDARSDAAVVEWRAPALGFTTAIVLTWLLLPRAGIVPDSWLSVWTLASSCTLPVLVATALVVWGSSLLLSDVPRRVRIATALDVGCIGTWFAPLAIFYRLPSPWAVIIGVVLAIAVARWLLLRYFPPAPAHPGGRRMRADLSAAIALQCGVLAMAIHDWQSCAVALAAGAVVLTWIFTRRAVWPTPVTGGRRRRKIRLVPAVFFGVGFSAFGLLSGPGYASGARETARQKPPPDGDANAVVPGESYPGVELLPDAEDHITLVAPLPRRSVSLFSSAKIDSLTIPFYGAYWYFKGPGPLPRHPFITRGDPAKLSFRSTDLGPLTMEARQNLGKVVNIGCCSGIGVVVRSADRHPGTVQMELRVDDSTAPGEPFESLGFLPVAGAAEQTLTFRFPAVARLRRFDDIAVLFHLLPPRVDRSARIAIRKFVFYR